jgi:hypothetical protein
VERWPRLSRRRRQDVQLATATVLSPLVGKLSAVTKIEFEQMKHATIRLGEDGMACAFPTSPQAAQEPRSVFPNHAWLERDDSHAQCRSGGCYELHHQAFWHRQLARALHAAHTTHWPTAHPSYSIAGPSGDSSFAEPELLLFRPLPAGSRRPSPTTRSQELSRELPFQHDSRVLNLH